MKNVYLIVCEENHIYKIGTTLNPLRLVKKLQTGPPEKLRLGYVFPSGLLKNLNGPYTGTMRTAVSRANGFTFT